MSKFMVFSEFTVDAQTTVRAICVADDYRTAVGAAFKQVIRDFLISADDSEEVIKDFKIFELEDHFDKSFGVAYTNVCTSDSSESTMLIYVLEVKDDE